MSIFLRKTNDLKPYTACGSTHHHPIQLGDIKKLDKHEFISFSSQVVPQIILFTANFAMLPAHILRSTLSIATEPLPYFEMCFCFFPLALMMDNFFESIRSPSRQNFNLYVQRLKARPHSPSVPQLFAWLVL